MSSTTAKKEELQNRITQGQRNANRLSEIVSNLPPSGRRTNFGDKVVRMLFALEDLEDAFCELYPDECLFVPQRKCRSLNKGTYHCTICPDYLNAVFGNQEQKALFV